MWKQTIPYQPDFVRKDRENSLTYVAAPYRTEIQTPKLDEFTLERQAIRQKSQSGEVNVLDSRHLERLPIREPSQDRYNDKRSGKHDCDEGTNDPKFKGAFKCKPTWIQVMWQNITITHARVMFENPSSTQTQDDEKNLLNQRI